MKALSLTKFNRYSILASVLIFAAIAFLVCIADRAPIHLEGSTPSLTLRKNFETYLHGVVGTDYPGPFVYRVLVPYLVFWSNEILPFVSTLNIDFVFKTFFLICCQLFFFYYLRFFFSEFEAIAGVFLLDTLISFTLSSIQGPTLIETGDILNLLAFIVLFISIYMNKFFVVYLILFIGTLNRETTWFVFPLIFLYEWLNQRRWQRVVLALIAVAIPFFGLRLLYQPHSKQWFSLHYLGYNIPFLSTEHTVNALIANLHVLFLLGPLLVVGLYKFREHPLYLKTVFSTLPLFILIHYIVGAIIESRLWMPLFPVLIPMVINNISKNLQQRTHFQFNC